jgi:hypothetical protein
MSPRPRYYHVIATFRLGSIAADPFAAIVASGPKYSKSGRRNGMVNRLCFSPIIGVT